MALIWSSTPPTKRVLASWEIHTAVCAAGKSNDFMALFDRGSHILQVLSSDAEHTMVSARSTSIEFTIDLCPQYYLVLLKLTISHWKSSPRSFLPFYAPQEYIEVWEGHFSSRTAFLWSRRGAPTVWGRNFRSSSDSSGRSGSGNNLQIRICRSKPPEARKFPHGEN